MKRGAEKQLTKDDAEEEDEEVSSEEGFKKAAPDVIAHRPIKGLPKRAAAGALAPTPISQSAAPEPQAAPKFNAFAGFGTTTTGTSSFSFTPSIPQKQTASEPVASAAPANSPFGPSTTGSSVTSMPQKPTVPSAAPAASANSLFGFGTSGSAAPSALFSSKPTVAPSASAATKTFASFVASSTMPSEPVPAAKEDESFMAEVDYLITLRGLNASLLSAVTKALESDPFVDIATILEPYKSFRISEKAKYDDKLKILREGSQASTKSNGASSNGSALALSASSALSMPKPVSGFTGFASPSSSSSTEASQTGGSDSSRPAFGFPSSVSSESSGPKPPEPPKSAFVFGSSSSASSVLSFASSTSNALSGAQSKFTFGKSELSSSTSTSGDASAKPDHSPNPFAFGSSSFPSSSNGLFGKPADKESKDQDASESTSSGATSSFFSGGGPSAFSTPPKASSGGAFASFGSTFSSPTKPFGFGKTGTIGNPVGFGFGSPPKTPDGETAPSMSKSAGFSFVAPPKAEPSASGAEEASGASTPAEGEGEAQPPLISGSVHDREGEGEENEVTTHEIRSKVFKMVKNDDGKSEWTDIGVGMLRLKKHKDTDSRRVLMRNSSTGKVAVNFVIYIGMNASVQKNTVSFIGHDNGTSTPYRVRTKTEDQASAFKAALDREIEFIRAKSDS